MQIKSFDKQNLDVARQKIQAALDQVAIELDLGSIKMKSITFDRQGTHFTSSIEAIVKADNNSALIEKQKVESGYLGYSDNIVGRTIVTRGETFVILGLNLKRPKWPIYAKNVKTEKEVSFQKGSRVEGVTFDAAKAIF